MTAIVTVLVYGPILFYEGLVSTVYNDHQQLVERNNTLVARLESLSGESPYSISLNNPQFGNIINATAAFTAISNPNVGLSPAKHACRIKITAPKENQEIATVISYIAQSTGCAVLPQRDPDIDPTVTTEAQLGSLTGCILIHMDKNFPEGGFLPELGNVFSIKRTTAIPQTLAKNIVWIQIGGGSVWRK